jgi:hypothetical protein
MLRSILYMSVAQQWCGYVDIDGRAVVSVGPDTVADLHRTCISFARISRIKLYQSRRELLRTPGAIGRDRMKWCR